MRTYTLVAALLAVLAGPAVGVSAAQSPQAQAPRKLELSFDANRDVSLTAQGVSVRDILAEWARQCGCFIVNADKLTGGPLAVPVQFAHTPQATVLQSLLRQAAGYILTPRRAGTTSASNYETIYILPTSHPTTSAYAATSAPSSVAVQLATPGSPDDETPPIQPPRTPIPIPGGAPPPAASQPAASGGFVPVQIVPIVAGSSTPSPPASAPTPPGGVTPAAPPPNPGR